MDTELLHEMRQFRDRLDDVLSDLYNMKEQMYDQWLQNNEYVDFGAHVDVEVVTSAPAAGALAEGEIQLGDGTGPGGGDEIFWSVDGNTVARVEADSTIT